VSKKLLGGELAEPSFPGSACVGLGPKVSLTNRTHLTTSLFRKPRHSAFSDRVEGPIALNSSPRTLEGSESLTRMGSPFDRLIVRLQWCRRSDMEKS
jgi:hypothetical protein